MTRTFETMGQLLQFLEKRDEERTVFEYLCSGQVMGIPGSVFFRQVRRRALQLKRLGFARNHVGIMGSNRWQWLAGLCAIFQVGAVAVPLSPELNRQELAEAAGQADLMGILMDGECLETGADLKIPAVSLDLEPQTEDYTEFAVPDGNACACMLFTSGTTARPKIAVFTHSALLAGICHNVIPVPFEAQLAILPMHHIAGFASVLNTWYLGKRICLAENVKQLSRCLREMKPDYMLTVPAILQALLRKLKNGGEYGSSLGWNLRLIGCGGATFPADVIGFLHGRKIRVLQSYGATEAGGIGFDWEMTPECGPSIGRPCPEMDVKIEDGQLFLRSPSLMSGYYRDPQATAQVLRDGWYATGDLCEQDADGYLYLRGRIRNLIVLGNGENVSPERIESDLLRCGLIGEIMVGISGGLISAWIYPNRGVKREELERAVDAYNASVPGSRQIINLFTMTEPFAKTETGKMIRVGITGEGVI